MLVAVSGYFDPVHVGHIRMFKEAAKLGEVVVILNNKEQTIKKNGKEFMPVEERAEILASIRYINSVFISIDKDETVKDSLWFLKPDIFANGGDRTNKNTPEKIICEKLGIKMVFNVGGEKIQASSKLKEKYENRHL